MLLYVDIMQGKLVYYILSILTWLKILFSSIMRIFVSVTEVKVVKNKRVYGALIRYYVIRILNYITRFLRYINLGCVIFQCMIDRLDISADLIQVHKTGRTVIYNTKNQKSISHVIQKINNIKDETDISRRIFLECKLCYGDELCLKPLMLKYRDPEMKYDHTLANILCMMDIDPGDDAIIKICYISGGRHRGEIPYKDVKDQHIVFLDTIDIKKC